MTARRRIVIGASGPGPVLDRALPLMTANPVIRTMLLGQFVGRPWRMSAPAALALVRNLGRRGLPEPVAQTLVGGFEMPAVDHESVTIAWGSRDLFTPRPSAVRLTEVLGHDIDVVELSGCGHLPSWDDPDAIALLIATATRHQHRAEVTAAL